jgi:hypothetical protein
MWFNHTPSDLSFAQTVRILTKQVFTLMFRQFATGFAGYAETYPQGQK